MSLEFGKTVKADYPDVITDRGCAGAGGISRASMRRASSSWTARIERRARRARHRERIGFLDPNGVIGRTSIKVKDARDGDFVGADIPARSEAAMDSGHGSGRAGQARRSKPALRNVAYALLSGADGWMFDGEDALGQVSTMSLDNQRNLKLAIHRDPRFLAVAEQVAGEMNKWATGLLRQADHRRLAPAAAISRPRSFALAACTSTIGTSGTPTAQASPLQSSMRRSTSSTTTGG